MDSLDWKLLEVGRFLLWPLTCQTVPMPLYAAVSVLHGRLAAVSEVADEGGGRRPASALQPEAVADVRAAGGRLLLPGGPPLPLSAGLRQHRLRSQVSSMVTTSAYCFYCSTDFSLGIGHYRTLGFYSGYVFLQGRML